MSPSLGRLPAMMLMSLAFAGLTWGQVLNPSPGSLYFSQFGGTAASPQTVTLTSNTGAIPLYTISISYGSSAAAWLTTSPAPGTASSASTIQVTPILSNLPTGNYSANILINPTNGGVATSIPVSLGVNQTGTGGTSGFSVSPNPVYLNASGQTSQTLNVSAPSGTSYTTSLSSNLINYVSVPPSGYTSGYASGPLTVSLTGFGSTVQLVGTLQLTPLTTGLSPAFVTIYVNTTSGGIPGSGVYSANPSSLNYFYTPGTIGSLTQYLQVSAPVGTTFSTSFSPNVNGFFNNPGFISANTQVGITLISPSSVISGTVGYLYLTPSTGGQPALTIPLYINTSGTGGNPGGTGLLNITPSSLTIPVTVGGPAPIGQTITVTTPTGYAQQSITARANSINNFLRVAQSGPTTPFNLSVSIDPSVLTTAGTYSGTITLNSNSGGGVVASIPVSVNVTGGTTVTPSPSTIALTGAAGGSAVQQNVQISSTDTTTTFNAVATVLGSTVNWLSVSPTSGTLGTPLVVTANPTGLMAGTYTGSVAISTVAGTVATIPVSFTVNAAAALQVTPTTLAFNFQTGSATPSAQPVQIASAGTTALNWTATPTSTGGWLQLGSSSGTTPSSLAVSVNPTGLTAGTYQGQISIVSSGANNGPQTVTVTLNVTTPVIPAITSIVNGASFVATTAAPGEIITIRGTDLGPVAGVIGTVNPQGFVNNDAGGTKVLFDGQQAAVLYASSTQINTLVPYEVAGRATTRVTVQTANGTSREFELRVTDTAPGLFTISGNGSGQAASLNQDRTLNSSANPERRGNIIVLYGTGHGQTIPAGASGLILAATKLPIAPVTVRIGGQIADILYAGSAPGLVSGAFQINARIPANVGTGLIPVEVQIGSVVSQTGVTIGVQ